jgi:hypothetical protein
MADKRNEVNRVLCPAHPKVSLGDIVESCAAHGGTGNIPSRTRRLPGAPIVLMRGTGARVDGTLLGMEGTEPFRARHDQSPGASKAKSKCQLGSLISVGTVASGKAV